MRYTQLTFFLLLVAVAPARGQAVLQSVSPETVGLSSQRLERIGNWVRSEIAQRRTPGAVVAIARRGKLAYFEAFGTLDPSTNAPMTLDAVFALASMTKPFAAVAILTLAEKGNNIVD
jgi:CubicO group peptidase (beta-lactamase class C family)